MELLRRVQRGALIVSLLSRQTGFGKSHMSNFLHARGQLSLEALDRVLEVQHLSVEDLIDLGAHAMAARDAGEPVAVKLLRHSAAAFRSADQARRGGDDAAGTEGSAGIDADRRWCRPGARGSGLWRYASTGEMRGQWNRWCTQMQLRLLTGASTR